MKQIKSFRDKLLLSGLLLLLCSPLLWSQTNPSGVSIQWNVEVGCQQSDEDLRDPYKPVYIEDIASTTCVTVCESSLVTYTLTGTLGSTPGTVWTVTGGTITGIPTSTTCVVRWGTAVAGAPNLASLGFTLVTPTGTVTKEICIQKVKIPAAAFTIAGVELYYPEGGFTKPYYLSCTDQELFFQNTSTNNGGSEILYYHWNFDDGTTSDEESPSHTFAEDGEYMVVLTVTNACGCKSTKKIKIATKSKGFDIYCPSVICEGQKATYYLPFDGSELCKENYNWSVQGGEIESINPDTGSVTVVWNHVDASGFGYVTFNPKGCNLECSMPTTIQVPIIKVHGDISGPSALCSGSQGLYSLPQWPSTEFHWQILNDPDENSATLIPTEQANVVSVTAIQTGTITLRATYENTMYHCGGTADFTILVSKPNDLVGENVLCQYSSATYTTSNGGNYDWVIKRNSSTVYTLLGSTFVSYPFDIPGSYTVSIASTQMCTNTTMGVMVYALPTPVTSVNGDTVVCPNAPYTYAIPTAQLDATAVYHWEITPSGSGSFVGTNVGPEVDIVFTGTGTHQVIVYKESQTPIKCMSGPKSITVTTRQINAQIALHGTTGNPICDNSVGQYDAVQSGGTALYVDGETYNWSIYDNQATPQPAPEYGSITLGQGTGQISVLWNNVNAPRHAKLRLEIRKCTLPLAVFWFDVEIIPSPEITINGATAICSGINTSFTVVSATPGVTLAPGTHVTWNLGYGVLPGIHGTTESYTYHNGSNSNLIRTITATISNPNGCAGTVTASLQLEVYPGPTGSISLSGGNAFCTVGEINSVLSASAPSGCTWEWYINGVPTGDHNSLYSPHQFGVYTIKITDNITHCTNDSNSVRIDMINCSPACTLADPTITVAAYAGCAMNPLSGDVGATISFSGTASAPYSFTEEWQIQGPENFSNIIGSSVEVTHAGQYNVMHVVRYLCSGQPISRFVSQPVIVPYIPQFNIEPTCNGLGNSTFTLNVNDNTEFYSPVTGRTWTYYIKLHSAPDTSYTQVYTSTVTGDGPLSGTYGNGQYDVLLVVGGSINGSAIPYTCQRRNTITLTTLPTGMTILSSPNPVKCHDSSVGFSLVGLSGIGNTFMWTFDGSAQNTQQGPSRVYPNSGTQPVSVEVANKYGCKVNVANTVAIPPKCFVGTTASNPNPAVACAGSSITLSYASTVQNCTPTYHWMDGTTEVSSGTANSYPMTHNGFYWVKVTSADNCTFETPNRITPLFKRSPSVKLQTGSSYCDGDTVPASVDTNGTGIKWSVDGVPQGAFDDMTSAAFSGLSVGTHTIMVSASINGECPRTASSVVEVFPMPAIPVLAAPQMVTCDPYVYELTVTDGDGNYTWSDGQSGETITVTHGGPYAVYSTVGGCRSMAQTDVPKNPDSFSWMLPSGCMSDCISETPGVLTGPNTVLNSWAWTLNHEAILSGAMSIPQTLPLHTSGSYTFTYSLGACTFTSEPLDYTAENCDKCKIKTAALKEVKLEDTKYCSYTVTISIESEESIPLPVTLSSPGDLVVIQPATFVMAPGPGAVSYTFTVIPINGYTGGLLPLLLTSTNAGKLCNYGFNIEVPKCGDRYISKTSEDIVAAAVKLYPNPAKDAVNVQFADTVPGAVLEIYDLTGRLMTTYTTATATGTWEVPLAPFATGVYIVVLRADDKVILQQKLIKE